MDYYYALLDSYSLLKKRKFKLSIHEQEDDQPDEGAAQEEARTKALEYMAAAKGKTFSHAKGIEGTETTQAKGADSNLQVKGGDGRIGLIWEKGDKSGVIMFSTTGENWGGGVVKIEGEDSPGFSTLVNFIMGKGQQNDGPVDQQEIDDKKEIETLGKKAANLLGALLNIANVFPGLIGARGVEGDPKHTRRPQTLMDVVRDKAYGFGTGLGGFADRVFRSDQISTQDRLEGLQGLKEVLDFFSLAVAGGWSNHDWSSDKPPSDWNPQDLQKMLSKIKVYSKGVTINGVFFFFRNDSSSETDVIRNMADQLDKIAEAYNNSFTGPAEKANKIDRLKKELAPSTGEEESMRGPVAEKFMLVSLALMRGRRDFAKATTAAEKKKIMDELKKKIAEVYAKAVEDRTLDELVETFGKGMAVLMGEIIGDVDNMMQADYAEACIQALLKRGVFKDEQKARDFVAAAGDPRVGVGHALMVTALVNQNFDKVLFGDNLDLLPDDIIHEGGEDSASSGRKADLVFVWKGDEDKCKELAEHYGNKLGGKTTGQEWGGGKLDSAGKPVVGDCEGEGAGVDNLVTHDPAEGGTCKMSVELKTLGNSKKKGGAGESSPSRITVACKDPKDDPEGTNWVRDDFDNQVLEYARTKGTEDESGIAPDMGMTQATRDFVDKNKARLDKCLGAGTSDKACAKHNELQDKAKEYTRLLTPGAPNVTPQMGMTVLDSWWKDSEGRYRRQQSDKNLERRAAAERAIRAGVDAKPEDLKQLDKVKKDMEQLVFMKEIKAGRMTDPDMKAYMAMQYTLACGSEEEVLRVTRGLGDNHQSVYLNNATQAEQLQMVSDGDAYWDYEGGGTFNLKDMDGNILVSDDTARGGMKWVIKKSSKKKLGESVVADRPGLMLQFFHGQQALLEKLINQTT